MVARHDVDDVNSVLTITLPFEEISPTIKKEIRKWTQKADIKGFRKGKVPEAYVIKMYGQSLVYDIVMKETQKQLDDYIKNENLNILGSPLVSKSQKTYTFLPSFTEDYVFAFDIGMVPPFELNDFKAHVFDKYESEIDDAYVAEEKAAILKQYSQDVDSDKANEESHLVFGAVELENGAVKEEGASSTFKSAAMDLNMDTFGKAITDFAVGDHFDVNIFEVEKNLSKELVIKYLINDQKETTGLFRLEVKNIQNKALPTLDQEFFDKLFGPDIVHSEEEFDGKIKESIASFKNTQSEAILYKDFQTYMIENNQVQLPEDFLKRVIAENKKENDNHVTSQKEYDNTFRHLKWVEIKRKLIQTYPVDVQEKDIREYFFNKLQRDYGQYLQYIGADKVRELIEKSLKDSDQVYTAYDHLETEFLFQAVRKDLTLNNVILSRTDFAKKVEANQAHDHDHDHEGHDHSHDHNHDHDHDHEGHEHNHDHEGHDHSHDHNHDHGHAH